MKIISGGQTGVDRAALDAALTLKLPYGGTVPRGRKDEEGVIPPIYEGLEETPSDDNRVRTRKNVIDADCTLLITQGPPVGGSAYTKKCVDHLKKPFLFIDLNVEDTGMSTRRIADWLRNTDCQTLNVAGPRKSEAPDIYNKAYFILLGSLTLYAVGNDRPASADAIFDRELIYKSHEQFNNNFRHWDAIRWNVSVGLLAFIAALAAGITAIPDPSQVFVTRIEIGVSFISAAWIYLLIRLLGYHNKMF